MAKVPHSVENFNRLSRAHERYRRQTTDRQTTDGQTTDGQPMTYSEHELEFTFVKNVKWSESRWNQSGGEEKVYGGN